MITVRTCFARKCYPTEPVELCQQDVYIDVSQTDSSTMQMKTTFYMREVSNKLAKGNIIYTPKTTQKRNETENITDFHCFILAGL